MLPRTSAVFRPSSVLTIAHTCKTYAVTGASSGFGRAMTELCLDKGDRVIATLRTPSALASLAQKHAASQRLLVLPLDVTCSSDVKSAFAAALKAFGRVDVVLNNAG